MERASQTLLVLEEDRRARELIVFLLERAGYQVLVASTAASALQILEEHSEISLLFADVGERNAESVVQLAAQMRALRPNLPMLYTAGLAGAVRTMTREDLEPEGRGAAARMLSVIKASLETKQS